MIGKASLIICKNNNFHCGFFPPLTWLDIQRDSNFQLQYYISIICCLYSKDLGKLQCSAIPELQFSSFEALIRKMALIITSTIMKYFNSGFYLVISRILYFTVHILLTKTDFEFKCFMIMAFDTIFLYKASRLVINSTCYIHNIK